MSFAETDFTKAAINKMYLVITQENVEHCSNRKPYKWILKKESKPIKYTLIMNMSKFGVVIMYFFCSGNVVGMYKFTSFH